MTIAVISDVHANLEALEAVMRDIEHVKADTIYCLGDVVGYGSDPVPCLELVQRTCEVKLMGNHEYAVLGRLPFSHLNNTAKLSLSWTRSKVDERMVPLIADLPLSVEKEDLHFVHASPYEPDHWHYILSQSHAELAFKHFDRRICFAGHSHLPMIFSGFEGYVRRQAGHDFVPNEESRYIVNAGSVGQPRDNDPRASYVLYDTVEDDIQFRRVEYDVAAAQKKMKEAALPEMLIERLGTGI